MKPAAIVAFGAVSSLGRGAAALGVSEKGCAAVTSVRRDDVLQRAGVPRSACARAAVALDARRRADALLRAALDDCVAALDRAAPSWRTQRVGLALGTSSGAMDGAERAYAAIARGEAVDPDDAYDLAYGAPFARARQIVACPLSREAHVLGACASSTIAIGLGALWLDDGACDVVLAGGYDVVTAFVASGFAALGAVTASVPRPFRAERDGLALGEGAAVVALARAPGAARVFVTGFGAASDARHLTAPDPDANGLVRACRAAQRTAGVEPHDVGLVGAHGTATVYNDASEARGFHALLGDDGPPVHAAKGQLGHTLGAAGALETLALAHALEGGVAPASAGGGDVDPGARVRVLDVTEASSARHALKTSLAFGGLDAALIVSTAPRDDEQPGPRRTQVSETSSVGLDDVAIDALAARVGLPIERVARWDSLTRAVVAAAADVAARFAIAPGADVAVVVGHDVATIATNAQYVRRIVSGRPAEPRRFPYTSPNACAGEASCALGLLGPAFAVGGAPGLAWQALDVARDLVAHGVVAKAIAIEVVEPSATADAMLAAWRAKAGDAGARAVLVTGVG